MIGHTFRYLAEHPVNREINSIREGVAQYTASHSRKNHKGALGIIVEECFFGYEANNNSNADFEKAGLELKVTPYIKTKKGFVAKERLVITKINYFEDVKASDFKQSHVYDKSKLMLLVWYFHVPDKMDSTINYVQLFKFPEEDLAIIISDYKKILDKIKAGKAHELSEGDTLYLGACTKAAKSSDRTKQPFSTIEAKPRAFSLKNSYMTYILNKHINDVKNSYERILDASVPDLEKYITQKINCYHGKSIHELAKIFNLEQCKAKNLPSLLAFRILGIHGNHAEEFIKAGIVVKIIRINKKDGITESMSFPTIDYKTLASENWDDCTFGNYLRETRFFFVIYKENYDGELYLSHCKFWNMPYGDIENQVRPVWQKMHDIVANGRIHLHIKSNGYITNNFPAAKDNPVAHVRPHARNKFDVCDLPENTQLSVISDSNITWPYDDKYTKHCFWLNNTYILTQINMSSSN